MRFLIDSISVEAEGRRYRYPSWFVAHSHWHTLDGRWSYSLHKNVTLRIANVSAHAAHKEAPPAASSASSAPPPSLPDSRHEQKATCHSVLELGESAARVVAHLSQGWCVTLPPLVSSRARDAPFSLGDADVATRSSLSPRLPLFVSVSLSICLVLFHCVRQNTRPGSGSFRLAIRRFAASETANTANGDEWICRA